MSVEAAQARVETLRALIGTAVTPTAAPGTSSFAGVLSTANATATVPGAEAASGAGAGAATPFAAEIDAAAAKHGVDPALLRGLIRQESNFDPNAGSPAGAQGLTQLMPGTARALGVTDVRDPKQAIEGGAKYLRQQLDAFGGNVEKALAAYNAGPGAVQKYGGIPPYAETRQYVQKVMAYAAEYRTAAPAAPTSATASTGSGKIT